MRRHQRGRIQAAGQTPDGLRQIITEKLDPQTPDPQITVQRAWQLSSGVEQALSLDDLFARSDAVTVHVPLNDHTRGLVSASRIALMRKQLVRVLDETGEAPMLALIFVFDARPIAIGSSWYPR